MTQNASQVFVMPFWFLIGMILEETIIFVFTSFMASR